MSSRLLSAHKRIERGLGAKYPGAVEGLAKDRDTRLAFYDFPAEHWIHLRTTNPIESNVRGPEQGVIHNS